MSGRSRMPCSIAILLALFIAPLGRSSAQEEGGENEEESTPWTASVNAQYDNKDNSGGVDMSNELAAFLYGARIEHSSGFSFGVGAEDLLGSGGGFVKWGTSLGYTFAAASWMNLSGELSYFKYENDSLNAIANLRNSLTFGVSFPNHFVNIGLSYSSYFGGGSASYYGLNLDRSLENNDFTVDPSLNFSFISQTIDQKRLVSYKKSSHAASVAKGKGLGGGGTTATSASNAVTVSGLSGITLAVALSYDLGSDFAVNARPAYVYSPKAELAAYKNEFLWSVGISYSRDF